MKKRISTQLSIVFAALLMSLVFVQCNSKDKATEKTLKKMVEAINMQCPITIDSNIRMDKSSAEGKELTLFYTILDDSQFKTELMDEMGVPFIKESLKGSMIDAYRENEVIIRYYFSNKDGKKVYELKLNPSEY